MQHLEIERRWLLIENRPLDWKKLWIVQVYLDNPENRMERLRKTIFPDGLVAYEHQFKTPAEVGQIEENYVLAPHEFMKLSERISKKAKPIFKERYIKEANGLKYEVDQFHSPVKFRILEVELASLEEEVLLLEELGPVIEVTSYRELSNQNISRDPERASQLVNEIIRAYESA